MSPTSRDVPCRRCPCRRLPGSLLHLVNGCSDGRLVTCRVFPPRTPGGPGVRVRLAVLHSAWLQWVSPVAAPRTRVGMSFRPDLLPAGSPRWRSQAVDYGHGNVGSTRLDRTLASSHARTYPASPEKKKKKKKKYVHTTCPVAGADGTCPDKPPSWSSQRHSRHRRLRRAWHTRVPLTPPGYCTYRDNKEG